jgi:hypothetical protein
MAQAPRFNPTVDPISYRPSPVVSGARDKGSTLSMLAGLGKMTAEGIDAYNTQSAMEQIDVNIDKLNQEYLQQSPTYLGEVQQEAGQEALFLEKMPMMAGFETGEQIDATYSEVEKSMTDKLSYLDKAKSQGKISPNEFSLRAKSIVRDVVAKNPHLTSEALRRLSQNLSMSGIQERMEMDETLLKSQASAYENQYKAITQEMKERDIPTKPFLTNGVLDMQKAEMFISDVRQQEFLLKEAKRAAEMGEFASKQNINELIQSGAHIKIGNGYVNKAWTDVSKIVNSAGDYNNKVVSVTRYIDDTISEINNTFASVSNDPTMKETMSGTIQRLNSLKDTVLKSQSGANLAEALQNQNTINTIVDKNDLRSAVGNLERLDMLSKFGSTAFVGEMLKNGNVDIVTNTLKSIVDMAKGIRLMPNHLETSSMKKQSDANIAFDIAAQSVEEGKGDASTMLNTNTSDRINVINSTEDLDKKFTFTEDYLKQVADPRFKNAVASLDPATKTESMKVITDFSKALGSRLKALSEQQGVTFSFTSDGLVSATGISRQDTLDVINRVNTALSAYANITGTSTKAASKDFFTSFYNNVFQESDLPNVEASYKSQAKALIPSIKQLESSGRMYETITDVFGNRSEGLLQGIPVKRKDGTTERALGAFQLMPSTMRRPGLGVTPVDFTKSGKAFEVEMERFATDYTEALLKRFDGDERKALAAYNAGYGKVEEAVNKAAKKGTPNNWVEFLPAETKGYLAKFSKLVPPKPDQTVALITTLRQEQDKIKESNPSVYMEMFDKGSSVELAKDIAEELSQNKGIEITWNEVHKYMEQNNLMPVDINPNRNNPRLTQSGRIRK